MSTRRLILTALACGLVILLAGGIQLVRLTGSEARPLPGIGQARTVSGVRVTPLSIADAGGDVLVTVELVAVGADAEGTAAGSGWRLLRGADLHLPVELANGAGPDTVPCATVTVTTAAQRCVLAFGGGGTGDRLLAYALGEQTARWDLDA